MASMNTSEMKEKSLDELQEELVSLSKDQFNYRMQKSTGQLSQTHLLKEVSKDIARVKTVMNQKRQQAQTAEA
jgi:large subunit ribosomal protein L29